MPLERFRRAKEAEVAALRQAADEGTLPAVYVGHRPDFLSALRTPSQQHLPVVVAEYKRASPSRGSICQTLDVEDVVRQYTVAGAGALSILTEEKFFQGHVSYLERAARAIGTTGQRLPLLRKDFLFDPLQIRFTASTPASALLLIVRLTPDVRLLRHLRESAEHYGMHAVVEVFDAADVRVARESGARIIQVNARDLASLTVNRGACLALARRCPPTFGETWIAASGLCRPEHLQAAAQAGFHAVLVGSALMEGGRPGKALAGLLGRHGQGSGGSAPPKEA